MRWMRKQGEQSLDLGNSSRTTCLSNRHNQLHNTASCMLMPACALSKMLSCHDGNKQPYELCVQERECVCEREKVAESDRERKRELAPPAVPEHLILSWPPSPVASPTAHLLRMPPGPPSHVSSWQCGQSGCSQSV